jgi:hypothetical protein
LLSRQKPKQNQEQTFENQQEMSQKQQETTLQKQQFMSQKQQVQTTQNQQQKQQFMSQKQQVQTEQNQQQKLGGNPTLLLLCGSCHIPNVLIDVEYRNLCRNLDVYLLFATWMGQIQSKLIYIQYGPSMTS